MGFRKTFTGYLDDVNGKFAGLEAFTSTDPANGAVTVTNPGGLYFGNAISKSQTNEFTHFADKGSTRGRNKTDWYVVTGLSLNYILTPRIKNPKFR